MPALLVLRLGHLFRSFCLLAFFIIFSLRVISQSGVVKANYTKVEQMIPMRDGVQLYTAIYLPKSSDVLLPFLIERTPYSCMPYGDNNYPASLSHNPLLEKDQYIFVFQNVRGRHLSQGKFKEVTPFIANKTSVAQVDESSDAFDTIEWLLKNVSGNNGKVGIYGISYPGFYATAALPNGHPAIKAISPQAPVTDEFDGDDVYHGGAFFLLDNVNFLNWFGQNMDKPLKDYPVISPALKNANAYDFYLKLGPIKNINEQYFKNRSDIWNEYLGHDTKDAYWESRNIRPHLKKIKAAVLTVGGWFDAEDLYGPLKTYEAIGKQNSGANNFLMMGPWTHGSWARENFSSYAEYQFGSNTNEVFRATEAAFFSYYLKGQGNGKLPEASIFFTGSNEWKTFSKWPAPNTRNYDLYLTAGKKLSTLPERSRVGFEQYESDPAKPVPYTALEMGTRDYNYMGADQRFSAGRSDVLVFETDPLKYDITMAGAIEARLFVSLSSTDADFVIKVIDVLPDSNHTQQMVRAEVLRGKFRNSFSKPIAFEPGKITPINLTLNDVAHTFKQGHKIMIHIQSSWFPLVDRNPQQFMHIPLANEADFQKATIRVERNARFNSVIQCKILK